MDAKDRIIVALDVDNLDAAGSLVESLAPYVGCFKVGLELLTAVGPPKVVEFVHSLGGQVFYDGKFNDIPNTVAGSAHAVTCLGVKMFNVHCLGGIPMMEAACRATEATWIAKERLKVFRGEEPFQTKPPLILGVTLLTSMDFDDLVKLGVWEDTTPEESSMTKAQLLADKRECVQRLVADLAQAAQSSRLNGVVCSPQEIEIVRKKCGPDFLIVTPGIRSSDAPPDDQKRTMTPAEAIEAGADYEVIGRPITKAVSPADAAKRIAEEMTIALERRR